MGDNGDDDGDDHGVDDDDEDGVDDRDDKGEGTQGRIDHHESGQEVGTECG